MSKKFKYKLVVLRKVNSIFVLFKVVKIKSISTNIITINNRSYNIIPSIPSYLRKNNTFIYMVDFDSGKQLNYSELQNIIDPISLKMVLRTNVMSQMSKSLSDDIKKPNMSMFLLGMGLGALISGMGVYIYLKSQIGVM